MYGAGAFPSNLEGSKLSGSSKYLGFLFVPIIAQKICQSREVDQEIINKFNLEAN